MNNTVLIVDDVQLNIFILSDILDEKYKISTAASGKQTIDLLNQTIPDLVMLDIVMPGIGGLEVLKVYERK